MNRPDHDDTLSQVAVLIAQHATCQRRKVGAVLTRDSRIISTGYNGAPSGLPHCEHHPNRTVDRTVEPDKCTNIVHAEANAIVFAAKAGVSTEGTTLYTTLAPCKACAQILINSGVVRVVAQGFNSDKEGWELLKLAGVQADIWKFEQSGIVVNIFG